MIETIGDIEPFSLFLLIGLALIFARVLGFLFAKIKQPPVIGEIVAGIILGWLGIILFTGEMFSISGFSFTLPSLNFQSDEFGIFAEIGILFLLFISGLEIRYAQLKKMEKASLFVATGGIILPLLLGIFAGILMNFNLQESIIVGLILIATSVGVTVRTLMDIHVLDSDVGATILGGAVIDDVVGILLLSFFLGTDPILYLGIKIAIFFVIFLYLGLHIMDKILDLGDKIQLPKAFLSISLAIFLLYTYFASSFGVAGIIGAFVAGLIIGHTIKYRKIIDDVQTIGYGLFIPLFFIWVGAHLWSEDYSMSFSTLVTIGIITTVIIVIAILGKILGCGLGAKLAGFNNREALQIGVGMVPRMELALIIVTSAISHRVLSGQNAYYLLIATLLLTIVTTLITPVFIKAVFKQS